MAVKLHRCPRPVVKMSGHPCWRVQKALDDMGVEYEVVKEPWPRRSRRTAVIEGTGQSALPGDRARGRDVVPRAVGRDGEGDPRGPLRPGTPPDRRYTSPLAGL